MDEVIIKGNKYISSKRASKISGYAKDYVGQLVRAGKLHAVKVGRSWFVDERGLLQIGRDTEPEAIQEVYPQAKTYLATAEVRFPPTWGEVKYYYDDSPLHPVISDTRETLVLQSENANEVKIRRATSRQLVEFACSGGSVDGIRVLIRKMDANTASFENVMLPGQGIGRASGFQTLLRAIIAGALVGTVVLFVPIFG